MQGLLATAERLDICVLRLILESMIATSDNGRDRLPRNKVVNTSPTAGRPSAFRSSPRVDYSPRVSASPNGYFCAYPLICRSVVAFLSVWLSNYYI